jgi:hypothetical protein
MKKEEKEQIKKKPEDKLRRITVETFAKLDSFLTGFNENKPEVNSGKFVHIAKLAFGDMFNIQCEYTYEELIDRIENIDKRISSISTSITDLKKQIDNAFINEKNNPQLKEKIDELEGKLLKEYVLENFYKQLKNVLCHENVSEIIKDLVKNLSMIEYSNEKYSNDKLSELINKFKMVLNKILDFNQIEQKKKKQKFISRLLRLIGLKNEEKDIKSTIKEPELAAEKKINDKPKNYVSANIVIKKGVPQLTVAHPSKQVAEVFELINSIKKDMDKKNISKAKKKYLRALRLYKGLDNEGKEQTYKSLLQMYHSLIYIHRN